jgi:hypothetical protein
MLRHLAAKTNKYLSQLISRGNRIKLPAGLIFLLLGFFIVVLLVGIHFVSLFGVGLRYNECLVLT